MNEGSTVTWIQCDEPGTPRGVSASKPPSASARSVLPDSSSALVAGTATARAENRLADVVAPPSLFTGGGEGQADGVSGTATPCAGTTLLTQGRPSLRAPPRFQSRCCTCRASATCREQWAGGSSDADDSLVNHVHANLGQLCSTPRHNRGSSCAQPYPHGVTGGTRSGTQRCASEPGTRGRYVAPKAVAQHVGW